MAYDVGLAHMEIIDNWINRTKCSLDEMAIRQLVWKWQSDNWYGNFLKMSSHIKMMHLSDHTYMFLIYSFYLCAI